MPRPRPHSRRNRAVTAAVTAAVSAAAYLGLLGWDQHKQPGADGQLHGPYETWQVATQVGLLAVLAAWAGCRAATWPATLTAAIVLTVCFSVDAATDAEDDGLWPVGALFVLMATALGFAVVGAASAGIRRRLGLFRDGAGRETR